MIDTVIDIAKWEVRLSGSSFAGLPPKHLLRLTACGKNVPSPADVRHLPLEMGDQRILIGD
jgi:predicted protein tyrosine phosphatase